MILIFHSFFFLSKPGCQVSGFCFHLSWIPEGIGMPPNFLLDLQNLLQSGEEYRLPSKSFCVHMDRRPPLLLRKGGDLSFLFYLFMHSTPVSFFSSSSFASPYCFVFQDFFPSRNLQIPRTQKASVFSICPTAQRVLPLRPLLLSLSTFPWTF